MRSLVLNELALRRHLPEEPCRACGSNVVWLLQFPHMTQVGSLVILSYPCVCSACEARRRVIIKMPILEFGYRLAHDLVQRYRWRGKRPKQGITLMGTRDDSVDPTRRDYHKLLAELCAADRRGPNDEDRYLLGMTEDEWTSFLRRADLDEQEGGGEPEGETP